MGGPPLSGCVTAARMTGEAAIRSQKSLGWQHARAKSMGVATFPRARASPHCSDLIANAAQNVSKSETRMEI